MTYPNATHVSAHITWAEVRCKDGTPYPEVWVATRLVPLAQEFENLRSLCDHQPIVILSAYRTPLHNKRVGGARLSQHLQGRALDLQPPRGMRLRRLHQLALEMAQQRGCRLKGIGLYPTFLHIDIRPSDRLVHWTQGTRATADVEAA